MTANRLLACVSIAAFVLCGGAGAAVGRVSDEEAAVVKAAGLRGGLIVQIGWGDGKLAVALAGNENSLVQSLEPDQSKVDQARVLLESKGLYGHASVCRLTGNRLPYVDRLVGMLVAEDLGSIPMAEVMRILSPGGEAHIKSGGKWTRTVKPRPSTIDDWTHFLYDPSNNGVSRDEEVAPPGHLQWVAGPDTERSHDHLASLSTAVSSGGRLFYVVDEAPVLAVKLPMEWWLVARDAFSGVVLWKRKASEWADPSRGCRDVTSDLARKLVAVGDRVYISLGKGQPIVALEAATGKTIRTYKGTEGTTEILCDGTWLYAITVDDVARKASIGTFEPAGSAKTRRSIVVLDAATGKARWRKCDADTSDLMDQTLAASGGSVFYQNGFEVICLNAADGTVRWRAARPANHKILTVPTLVVSGDLVLSADNVAPGREKLPEPAEGMDASVAKRPMVSELIVYSAKDGKMLWSCPYGSQFFSHVDVFRTDAGVWTGDIWSCISQGYTELRNPATGEILKRRPADQAVYGIGCPHHRCYKDRASKRYILMGRSGVEFFDSNTGEVIPNHWIRGTCQYGILPANGLLYVPPHPCACYVEAKIVGFNVLAPRAAGEPINPVFDDGNRLEVGRDLAAVSAVKAAADDWPTYRHDNARSGMTSTAVPDGSKQKWAVKLGSRVSAPVIAAGKVFVAAIDEHSVHAIDAASGKRLWKFVADSRVDSPPTYHDDCVLFGSRDGWVYRVRAADGVLVWRFKAAPRDRHVVAYGEIESAWPVHGAVLVQGDEVCFAAGRSSYLDGGMFYYRIDARTGRQISVTRLDDRDPKTGYQPLRAVASVGFDMAGALPDVLSAKDGVVYMRHTGFDADGKVTTNTAPHLFSAAGFLDDSWFHRGYMIVGTRMASGFVDWARAGNETHAGELLVVGDKAIYGYGRNEYGANGSHPGLGRTRYRLFAADKKLKTGFQVQNIRVPNLDEGPAEYNWLKEVPFICRAMTLADGVLWVAGPLGAADLSNEKEVVAGIEGRGPGLLWAVSAANGAKIAEHKLEKAPVYDGMAAAGGRLFVSLLDGTVVCYGGK